MYAPVFSAHQVIRDVRVWRLVCQVSTRRLHALRTSRVSHRKQHKTTHASTKHSVTRRSMLPHSLTERREARLWSQWRKVSCSRKWSSHPYPHNSSSGPRRYLAPRAFACLIERSTLSRFPSKSRAHWSRLHAATVTRGVLSIIAVSMAL